MHRANLFKGHFMPHQPTLGFDEKPEYYSIHHQIMDRILKSLRDFEGTPSGNIFYMAMAEFNNIYYLKDDFKIALADLIRENYVYDQEGMARISQKGLSLKRCGGFLNSLNVSHEEKERIARI